MQSMFEKTVLVNGKSFRLRPYTEKRLGELETINKEIREYVQENMDKRFDEIDPKRKADWYMRKAQVLWHSDVFPGIDFFRDADFEVSLLQESESFFVSQRLYL